MGSCSWRSEGLFSQSFSVAPPIQALRGLPCLGSFSVVWRIGHIEGPTPLAGVLLCRLARQAFDGPASLLFSCPMLACGDREAVVMTPSPTCDSAVLPCFCGCLAFLHRHFPPQSPSSHPLDPSVCSQQQPSPWDCSTISKLQLPAAAPSRRSAFLRGTYGCSKDCLIRIHLGGHRSAVSLSALNVSPLTQTIVLMWGSDPGFSSPPVEGRSSPTNTPVFLPSSLVLPSFAWFYIFFSASQVLLFTAGALHVFLCLKVYS